MTSALFEGGTPEAPGAALAAYRAVKVAAGDAPLRWCVDPGNVGLLSRAVRELSGPIDVVLRADDQADDRTVVADEAVLVPILRRLVEQAPARIRLRMTNGRPYVLPPPALDISTNDLCGLECNMCGNRASRRDPETIAPEDVTALLRLAADWGIRRVALTGAGEPFRDPRMLDHVEMANALGHLVTITTNGFPVSDKIAATLARGVVSVSVSIHGATDESHDAITGVPKAGEAAWRAIGRMVRARDAHAGSKLSVSVSTVIQKQNVHEVPDLVRRAHAAGCNGINIQPVNLQHGFFREETIVRRDDLLLLGRLWPNREQSAELDRVFGELRTLRAELGKFVHASEERLALLRRYFTDSSREALQVGCRVGEAFLAVDHRGRIKPCYRLPWSHGDARVTNLRTLWNSAAYARTRALVDQCPLTCMNNCFFRDKRAPS